MVGNNVFGSRTLDSRIAGGQTGGVMSADETINACVHCDDAELWRGLRRHEETVPRPQAARHRDQLPSALLGELRLKMEHWEDEVLGEAVKALARHRRRGMGLVQWCAKHVRGEFEKVLGAARCAEGACRSAS